jgi:hypothetical protein
MVMDARGWGWLLFFTLGLCPLWGQAARESSSPGEDLRAAETGLIGEPEALIGLTLEGLYRGFGVPQAVWAVRGGEEWQDDVILAYPQGDFYVYRDRVWQLRVPSARGIRRGDSREAVALALGEGAAEGEDCFVLPIPGRPWPLALRVNMDSGRVSGIFVYRSDF